MKLRFALILIVALLFTSNALAENIVIPGTGDGVAVLKSIGKEFTKKTGVEVTVPKSIGSGGGVKAAGADKAKIARVARGIKDKEKHFGLSYKAIFQVPTVIFVNRSVSVKDLSEQQVLDIFAGKITSWKEVGGADKEIVVVRREDGDSSYSNLKKTFPGFKDIAITEKAMMATKTPMMIAQIANRANTIGFGPLDVAFAHNLKPVKVNGIKATSEKYPYHGTLGLVYLEKNLTGSVKDFVDFVMSNEAHSAIKKAGGTPLN